MLYEGMILDALLCLIKQHSYCYYFGKNNEMVKTVIYGFPKKRYI